MIHDDDDNGGKVGGEHPHPHASRLLLFVQHEKMGTNIWKRIIRVDDVVMME